MTDDRRRVRPGAGARVSWVMTVALLALAGCNEFRNAELVRSVRSTVNRPGTLATMEWAIETTLARRHWEIREHVPQRYVADLTERIHKVQVAIIYNDREFSIDYLNSSNLLYNRNGDGSETIHRKYLTWVKNLADGIRAQQAEGGLPGGLRARNDVPPPPPANTQVR
jgi:hypothetical protein